MVRHCMVRGCRNSSETPNVMIHPFPTDRKVKKSWLARLSKEGCENNAGFKFRMKRYYNSDLVNGVCSAHFKQEDFVLSAGKKCLKKGAEPSIFSSACMKEEDALCQSASEPNKVDESQNTWGDFANLPELVLCKIFNYLTFENRLLVGSVCRRWYDISRSPAVWKEIQIDVPSPYHLLRFIVKLPPSVRYLSIHCWQNDIHNPLWLPDILSRVYQRCPLIKSVIFENVYFSQRFCNTSLTTDHVLCSSQTTNSFNNNKGFKNVRDRTVCVNECCRHKQDKYRPENLPAELTLLSVRLSHSFFAHLSSSLSQYFPKIKILDLSFSVSVKNAVIPFFTRLSNLEELYLSGCPIRNSGIENLLKHLPKLKVLDLEHSPNVDDDTFQVIQTHGRSLEKLYLGFTSIKRVYTFYELVANFLPVFQKNEENHFPHLEELCLKSTAIDSLSIMHLAIHYPSLKFLTVVECDSVADNASPRDAIQNRRRILEINQRSGHGQPCFHFKSKYAI